MKEVLNQLQPFLTIIKETELVPISIDHSLKEIYLKIKPNPIKEYLYNYKFYKYMNIQEGLANAVVEIYLFRDNKYRLVMKVHENETSDRTIEDIKDEYIQMLLENSL